MKLANQFLLLLAAIGLAAAVTVFDHGNGDLYTLSATQDSSIKDDDVNYGNSEFLLAGLLPDSPPHSPKTRFLVQFKDLPDDCTTIQWAKMYVYFAGAPIPNPLTVTQAPYIERDLRVHQVSKSWKELEVTSQFSESGTPWSMPYLALTGEDASPIFQDTVTIFTDRPAGFVEFDVTQAMINWKSGAPNYGLIVRATNEETEGRNLRFYSQEASPSGRAPIIKVLCN